ncbi:hypothetical protein [Cupriavidus necator]
MLLMTNSGKLASVLPDRQDVLPAEKATALGVPFAFDFSGWLSPSKRRALSVSDKAIDTTISSTYADGEGNRCRSLPSGNQAFNAALQAARGLQGDEAAQLRALRERVAQRCATPAQAPAWEKPRAIRSPLGQQFATYLEGAYAFYAGNFAHAAKAFDTLRQSTDPWLQEIGRYMVVRAWLNAAQAHAFEADYRMHPERVDKLALVAADTALADYLRHYPHGQYAASAIGLQRRLAWLGAHPARLAAAYDRAFAEWAPATSHVALEQLANELDHKLVLPLAYRLVDAGEIHSPAVLALVALMRMRANSGNPLTLAELLQQKARFAAMPALHDYLLATYLVYVDKQPQRALALLPPAPAHPLDYLGFSQQMLRGFALEDSGQSEQARQLWTQLMPLATRPLQRATLELALASLEQTGAIRRAFAIGSPIQDPGIRAVLLQHDADASLLRQQARDDTVDASLRDNARYTLLYKELTRGRYQAFLHDLALIPYPPSGALKPFTLPGHVNDDGYACPAIREVAMLLRREPDHAKGQNCLAEFVRQHPSPYPKVNGADALDPLSLGSAKSQFGGQPYARMDSYVKVINNGRAPHRDRDALYRAIRCFEPTGYSECGRHEIPRSTRKQWFVTLQSMYPRSQWARALKYYW